MGIFWYELLKSRSKIVNGKSIFRVVGKYIGRPSQRKNRTYIHNIGVLLKIGDYIELDENGKYAKQVMKPEKKVS